MPPTRRTPAAARKAGQILQPWFGSSPLATCVIGEAESSKAVTLKSASLGALHAVA